MCALAFFWWRRRECIYLRTPHLCKHSSSVLGIRTRFGRGVWCEQSGALNIWCEQGRGCPSGFAPRPVKKENEGAPCVRSRFFWWRRRESNPCPKARLYNLLRGQSVYLGFPFVSADGQALTRVALFCVTGSRAKARCTVTTDLTHGGSRSPLPRYGRSYDRDCSLRCKSNFIVVV